MSLVEVQSKNGVSIRLTKERWEHITFNHPEITDLDLNCIIDAVSNPELILKGDTGELLAIKKKARNNIWFVVPYREVDKDDGFILTAYLTTNLNWLLQRDVIWNKK